MAAPRALVGAPFEVEISTIQTDLRGLKTACAVWETVAGGVQGLRFDTALTSSCQSNRPERLGRPTAVARNTEFSWANGAQELMLTR